jgi:Zn-dependent metalloprotease
MCYPNHRHSIFCILPPHILNEIAKNGTPQQRESALQTLGMDHSIRANRLTFSLLGGLQGPHVDAASPAVPQKQRSIYDAHHAESLPGSLVRSEGQAAVADKSVNQAYDGLGDTFDFYLNAYQRNSIDNKGLPLKASVHYGKNYDNAFWNGQQMVFGDGDNKIFTDFTNCLDVIGHELTHGVTGSEANLTYQGQPGALNESISDVFGCLVKQKKLNQTAAQADWLIGAGLLAKGIHGVALRSMKAPGTAYDDPVLGKDPQPATMAGYVQTAQDNGGVHLNSGIPNHAFFLVASAIGGNAWEKAGQIWYDTLLDPRLKPSANFAAFANLTSLNAGRRYGSNSSERKAVIDGWHQVGVTLAAKSAVAGATS